MRKFISSVPGVSNAVVLVSNLDLLEEVLGVLIALVVEGAQLVAAVNPVYYEVLDLDSLMVTHLFFNPFD